MYDTDETALLRNTTNNIMNTKQRTKRIRGILGFNPTKPIIEETPQMQIDDPSLKEMAEFYGMTIEQVIEIKTKLKEIERNKKCDTTPIHNKRLR